MYFDKRDDDFNKIFDIVEIHTLYRELTHTVGKRNVEYLNNIVKNRFFISMAGDIYFQILISEYIEDLMLHKTAEIADDYRFSAVFSTLNFIKKY